MVHIISIEKRKPIVRLARVQETSSGKTWIFDFVDPVHKFAQSIIIPKFCHPEHIEACYEALWVKWSEKVREMEWRAGEA